MQDVLWCSLPVRSLERLNSFEIQGASDQGPVNMAQGEHTGGWRVRKPWIRDDLRLLKCQLDPSSQYFWPTHWWFLTCRCMLTCAEWRTASVNLQSSGMTDRLESDTDQLYFPWWCLQLILMVPHGPYQPTHRPVSTLQLKVSACQRLRRQLRQGWP